MKTAREMREEASNKKRNEKPWLVKKLGLGCTAAALYALVFFIGRQFATSVADLLSTAGVAAFIAAGWLIENSRKE